MAFPRINWWDCVWLYASDGCFVYDNKKMGSGDLDTPVWKSAWQTYKQVFVSANLAGGVFALIGIFLYADLRIVFELMQGFWSTILYFFLMFLLFLVGIAFCSISRCLSTSK